MYKYLVGAPKDYDWGIVVNTVGSELIEPGFSSYPPSANHPEGFFFDVNKGRILESYQLLYIASGKGVFYDSVHEVREIGAGDVILLRPGKWHSYMPASSTGWHEYWIGFKGPNIDSRFQNGFFDAQKTIYRVGVREDISSLYEKAMYLAETEKISYQQFLAGIVNILLGMVMYYDGNQSIVSDYSFSQIDKAKKIMRDRIFTDISLEDIAFQVNMSYSWFRKKFKDFTGVSPAHYIQELKLQEACHLLSTSSLSIKEIAFRLNCGDPSYFSNMFQRSLKMTPKEYRRRFGSVTAADSLVGKD